MKRTELLDTLRRTEPSLAARDDVPAYTMLFFDGKLVYAYDGLVAIRAPCDFPFKGGVRGKQLISFLGACTKDEFELQGDEKTFKLKVGTAKLRTPLMDLKSNPYPKEEQSSYANDIEFSPSVAAAFKACGVTLGVDPSTPALLGITMVVGKNTLKFYSAVSHAATIATVDDIGKIDHSLRGTRVLLPVRFCELVLANNPEVLRLPSAGFNKSEVQAIYKDGTRIRATTVADEVDLSTIESVEKQVKWEGFVKFPNKANFLGAVGRALVILGGDEQKESTFRVGDGKLWISTKGDHSAHATDVTSLVGTHADIEVKTRPALLAKALEFADHLRVFKHSIALTGPGYRGMIAVAPT